MGSRTYKSTASIIIDKPKPPRPWVQIIKINGELMFRKPNLTELEIQGFKAAEKLGIGVKGFLWGRDHYSQAGYSIKQALQLHITSIQKLHKQAFRIERKLFQNFLVHQDIKHQNAIVDKNGWLKLIDNGCIRQLQGSQIMFREVHTPHINGPTERTNELQILRDTTDVKGFDSLHNYIESMKGLGFK